MRASIYTVDSAQNSEVAKKNLNNLSSTKGERHTIHTRFSWRAIISALSLFNTSKFAGHMFLASGTFSV